MSKITIVVADLSADDALKIAERVAENLRFSIDEQEKRADLRLRKGSLFLSIAFGAFILYVDFKLFVEETKRGDTRLMIEWSPPWWTGFLGANRTRNSAKALANELEFRFEKAGCEVVDRRDV